MIKIEHVETYGWEAALRGMRNPLNSWAKADTTYPHDGDFELIIGPRDMKLARSLANAGTDHGKFLRMIGVAMDITAPLYWWKEADTYKVGTVANSCSTMHKIAAKPFTRDDFSHDGLKQYNFGWLDQTIERLNHERDKFNANADKEAWRQMILMLPSSYNQRRTVTMNYAVLRNIYPARKNHKLTEWHEFCRMIEGLPYASELIIGVHYGE